MLTNVIIILIILSVIELVCSNNSITFLSYSISITTIMSFILFYFGFDILAATLVIIYCSVFLSFVIISFGLSKTELINNNNMGNSTTLKLKFLMSIISSFFLIYFSNSYYLFSCNSSQSTTTLIFFKVNENLNNNTNTFNSLIHLVAIKFFFIESFFLNILLLFGVIWSITILNKKTQRRRTYVNKNSKVVSRRFNGSSRINK